MFAVEMKSCVIIICIIANFNVNAKIDIEKCLEKESITCLQTVAYRQIREFDSLESVPLVAGLELVKKSKPLDGARAATDVAADILDSEQTGEVEKREVLLEQYVVDKASQFATERTLRWSVPVAEVTSAVRSFAENLPTTVGSVIAEGRAKKILKAIIPVLLGMKLKAVGFIVLVYLAIAVIAKQAIIASVISLAVSGLAIIRSIVHARHHSRRVTEHHIGAVVPAPSFGHVGYDLGDSFSVQQPTSFSHGLPYSAYKPLAAARR